MSHDASISYLQSLFAMISNCLFTRVTLCVSYFCRKVRSYNNQCLFILHRIDRMDQTMA